MVEFGHVGQLLRLGQRRPLWTGSIWRKPKCWSKTTTEKSKGRTQREERITSAMARRLEGTRWVLEAEEGHCGWNMWAWINLTPDRSARTNLGSDYTGLHGQNEELSFMPLYILDTDLIWVTKYSLIMLLNLPGEPSFHYIKNSISFPLSSSPYLTTLIGGSWPYWLFGEKTVMKVAMEWLVATFCKFIPWSSNSWYLRKWPYLHIGLLQV